MRVDGHCTPVSPASVQLCGPPVNGTGASSFAGVVFTAANPCGATVTVDLPIVETPLQVIATWGGCVGMRTRLLVDENGCPVLDREGRQIVEDYSEPGDLALLRGTVIATVGERDPQDRVSLTGCIANMLSAAPEVKLRVHSCGMPEPVIIDSDSELVLPAGPCTIEVLAPSDWLVGPVGAEGSPETPWMSVHLRFSCCPCSCSYLPEGRLSEWFPYNENDAAWGLVRPRRARKLNAYGNTSAGGAPTVSVRWQHSQLGGPMGATLFAGNIANSSVDLIGAAPFALVTAASSGAGATVSLVWGII